MRTLMFICFVVGGLTACSSKKPATDQGDVTATEPAAPAEPTADGDAAPMPVESKCVTPDGREVAIGESFPAADGCNTCHCSEAGGVACTEKACIQE